MSDQSDVIDSPSPLITKETRKLRKKKVFMEDELSNEDSDAGVTDEDSVDQIDTDDLLEEADSIPPFRPTLVKRKVKTKRRVVQKKKAADGPQKLKVDKGKKAKKKVEYIPEQVKQLAAEFPDHYWTFHADTSYDMIDTINEDSPLQAIPCNMSDQAPITSMSISPDGTLLATFSNVGAIKIWDIEDDFRMVRKLRDIEEMHIDEFYCGKFVSESQGLLVTGGKLKDRHRFSVQDEDNHILPCPIKVFDIQENKVLSRLDGHMEEILCIKALLFKNENYFISTSQDGYIIKWHMDSNWTTLLDSTRMEDGITCMAFTVSFLPHTGNKYFMGACDEHLRLYDFEDAQLLQTFEDMYSSYCDCGKFVKWLDAATFESARKNEDEVEEMIDVVSCDENEDTGYAWFISRGAEMCDVSEGVSSLPNTATLHKLIYPTEIGGKFVLEQVQKYKHEDYHANSWLVKVTCNGRYLLAPTIYGQIFVFNMLHGQLTAILKDHEDVEVRDVIFHPYRPLIFSSGDDGCVKVYSYKDLVADATETDLLVGNDHTC